MSDDSGNTPSGPDLSAGVLSSSLADGTMLLGHVGDEAVLIARAAGSVHAIGATCTHYGGPLAEGLLDGDTVRCPWHHACFSLRTGEPLLAPALDSVSCFRVEEKDGSIFVRERVTPASLYARTIADAPSAVVIIGAGAAGVAAAEMLRRSGYTGSIKLIEQLDSFPVDRPNLSKDYLAGTAQEEWVSLRSPEFYTDNSIELIRNSRVARIDTSTRRVVTDDAREIPFDRLLIATGASPIRLDLPGADLPHVHYLRTLQDSKSIIAAAQAGKHAVIIGASFIGLEVAASLRARQVHVDVVGPEAIPLERVVGPELGLMVRELHEKNGVVFHLGHQSSGIDSSSVHLDNGDTLPADFVVIGVGVRPDVALAKDAGIDVDNGVVLNDRLETSVPGIFAAGDIASWPDPRAGRIRVEHWVVAERQGQTAARNMLGANEPFTLTPFFWSRHYDLTINYVGRGARDDVRTVDGNPAAHDCTVSYASPAGVLRAEADVGRDRASLEAEVTLDRQR